MLANDLAQLAPDAIALNCSANFSRGNKSRAKCFFARAEQNANRNEMAANAAPFLANAIELGRARQSLRF